MITIQTIQSIEHTQPNAYNIVSEDGRVIAKGKLVVKSTDSITENETSSRPNTCSIGFELTLTAEYVGTIKDDAYREAERQYKLQMKALSKLGWGYVPKMRPCRGYPQLAYWLRTRSNPFQTNYH